MRYSLATLGALCLFGCSEGALDPSRARAASPHLIQLSRGLVPPQGVVSEDVTLPDRAKKLKDSGFDPGRFGHFVAEFPPAQRRRLLWFLDHAPMMMLQSSAGSREGELLHAARMTEGEKAAWKLAKKSGG